MTDGWKPSPDDAFDPFLRTPDGAAPPHWGGDRSRSTGAMIVSRASLAVASLAGVGLLIYANLPTGDSTDHVPPESRSETPAATPRQQTTLEYTMPDGWVRERSERGAFTWAHGPDWTNVTGTPPVPGFEDVQSTSDQTDGSGTWLVGDPVRNRHTVINSVAYADNTAVGDTPQAWKKAVNLIDAMYDRAYVVTEGEFTSAHGYDVTYTQFEAQVADEYLWVGLYTFFVDDSFVMVQVTSDAYRGEFADDVVAVVNSIEVDHTPTD